MFIKLNYTNNTRPTSVSDFLRLSKYGEVSASCLLGAER